MKKLIVEYPLPYAHVVQVGITADTHEEAIAKAEALFDEDTIWNNTPDVPLLMDEYEEVGNAGVALEFEVVDEVEVWPEKSWSVREAERDQRVLEVCRTLAELDPASATFSPEHLLELVARAKQAVQDVPQQAQSTEIVICLVGGVVESVVSNSPVKYVTLDFDTDSATKPEELVEIKTENGDTDEVWRYFGSIDSWVNANWVSGIHKGTDTD